jgi:hypothetical protein
MEWLTIACPDTRLYIFSRTPRPRAMVAAASGAAASEWPAPCRTAQNSTAHHALACLRLVGVAIDLTEIGYIWNLQTRTAGS